MIPTAKMVVPFAVLQSEGIRACGATATIAMSSPSIAVNARASGGVLILHVSSLSAVNLSADITRAARFRAFVDINGRSMLLGLPTGGALDVALPRVGTGKQTIRYGVFSGARLVNGGIICL